MSSQKKRTSFFVNMSYVKKMEMQQLHTLLQQGMKKLGRVFRPLTQLTFICSQSTIEIREEVNIKYTRNTRKMCEVCLLLTIKTPERCNFELVNVCWELFWFCILAQNSRNTVIFSVHIKVLASNHIVLTFIQHRE